MAGPGPICLRCNDDKWRLSARHWCDACEASDRAPEGPFCVMCRHESCRDIWLWTMPNRKSIAPAQSGDVLDDLWWKSELAAVRAYDPPPADDDPKAHQAAGRSVTHDEIAEVAFAVIVAMRSQGITDPLRMAHAVAVAVKVLQDDDRAEGDA